MSLRDEIRLLMNAELSSLREGRQLVQDNFKRSVELVEALRPALAEIASAAEDASIKIDIIPWGYNTAAVIRVGDVELEDGWTDSGNMRNLGDDGEVYYFFPCQSTEGTIRWSCFQGTSGHEWFDSAEEMLLYLAPLIAESLARHEFKKESPDRF